MIDHDETIVAIASPSSPALRGVVRLSGNQSAKILSSLGIAETGTKIPHSVDAIVDVGAPIGNVPVRVMLWPTSRSYTGQPSAELHTVGSLPVLQALVDAITRVGGRAARPGEFTMRAFLSGRLDLTQAEAVLGVIEAEQRGSLDHALRQLAGNLSRPLQRMRADVLNLLADVEAGLDFVDEDIEFISDDDLLGRLKEIGGRIIETSEQLTVRGGGAGLPVVVIRGEPNAGKSQLLNRLTGEPSAIVADLAGTTRDTVAAETVIEGFSVTLVDTAGIEPSSSSDISVQSQAHASRAANDADLRIWCVDSSRHDFDDAADRLRQAALESGRKSVIDVWVATKSDLPARFDGERDWIQCSAISGAGIGEIRRAIAESLSSRDGVETGSVIGSAARCRQSLFQASQAVAAACDLVENQQGHEFVSAELRQCATCLGEVTGAVYTDDILDRVFDRFCIGK